MSRSLLAKVVFAGDGSVGKTTLINRFLTNQFLENTQMTIGVAFYIHPMTYDGQQFKLQIWDLGGQKRFHEVHKSFFAGAAVSVIMFDLSNLETIMSVPNWVERANADNEEPSRLILVGGKKDLVPDQVLEQDSLEKFLNDYNFDSYFEVSSKTKEGVEELFQDIARLAISDGRVKSLARY